MLGRFRGVLLAAALVPAFFVMEHVRLGGIPEAQGCGGSTAIAPPPSVRVERPSSASGATSFEVASDGFFVLRTYFIPIEDPARALQVSVTSEGVAVPGTLKRLETTSGDMFGWQADQELPLGTKLDVKAQTTQSPGVVDEVTLTVSGPPTVLGAPSFSISSWVDFRMGVGESVTCPSNGSCSYGAMLTLPGAEQALHAGTIDWQLPQITGFVAWQARLETAAGPDMIGLAPWQDVFSEEAPRPLGILVFPETTERYCASLIVKDLRTGLEQKSEQCVDEPGKASFIERNYGLAQCSSPPPGLKAQWCEIYSTNPICADRGNSDPDQRPPTTGLPPNLGNDIVGSPNPMDPLRLDDTEPRAQTSESCQISAPGSLTGSSVALLLAFGAALARRRRSP